MVEPTPETEKTNTAAAGPGGLTPILQNETPPAEKKPPKPPTPPTTSVGKRGHTAIDTPEGVKFITNVEASKEKKRIIGELEALKDKYGWPVMNAIEKASKEKITANSLRELLIERPPHDFSFYQTIDIVLKKMAVVGQYGVEKPEN
jgi:hypothetical protein